MKHCRHHEQPDSDEEDQQRSGDGSDKEENHDIKKNPRGLDISIRFFDNYIRTMDVFRNSLQVIKQKQHDQDAAVNFGVGYVEDKKLTHGISMGGVNSGIYGGTDLVYNKNIEEYLVSTKVGDIKRFDWSGTKLEKFTPSKRFSRFVHIFETGHYVCYNPGKTNFFVYREDWTLAMDTVAIMQIDKIIYTGKKVEEHGVEFFIISGCTANKYAFSPTTNIVTLLDSLKLSDMEADNAEIEQVCFDQPLEEKKQWIYLTYKQNVTIIDVIGRVHGTKKNLHPHRITAIVAYGSSEFVVTGDEKGLLKMWGPKWVYMTEVNPHSTRVTHLIEHPNGRAVISFAPDQIIFAWSLDSKLKLESMKSPEIVERLAINHERKAFMTLGPRKLVIWKMDVLFYPLSPMSAPVLNAEFTWNPNFPARAVVCSQDNAIRVVNPVTGRILKSALVNPVKPPLNKVVYLPQYENIYVLKTSTEDVNSLCVQIFDATVNPCKLKDTWEETKWDAGVTAVALYDMHQSIVISERGVNFVTTKKQLEVNVESATFLICGLRDGSICKVDLESGAHDYKTSCHKGQVNQIEINPELNQFVSLGVEPSIRIWKVDLKQEDFFIPLFDITWKYPIRHVAIVRDVISFALSYHESSTHKVVVFNCTETERYDHRQHFSHQKEIISLSSSKELLLFCSASTDETVRIWSDKAELVRLLVLNWKPSWAGFGTSQGDIFIGIENTLNVVPADKYLSVIYRNRAIMSGLNAGVGETPTPLNATRSSQDPRMYIVLEEEDRIERETKEREKEIKESKDKKEIVSREKRKEQQEMMEKKIPKIGPFLEPKDSQRAKDFDRYRLLEEDLKLIIEGNHPFSIHVPDFKKMTKKQLDDYGKTIFPDDGNKRKMFASESRMACLIAMDKNSKEIDNDADYQI